MKFNTANKKLIALLSVIVIILIVSSVVYTMLTGISGDRKSSIEKSLSISEPPSLNTTAEVIFTFSALNDLTNTSNLRAEIVLPPSYGDGFEWVGDQPKWKGSLMEGDEILINGTFKATKAGNWTISAIIFWATSDNYSIEWGIRDGRVYPFLNESLNVGSASFEVMYISVSDQDAYISDDPFPEYRPESEEYLETLTEP